MRILGIETSCDETAASVVQNGRNVISSVISSQIEIHGKYFGVVPELASRAHIENVNGVVQKALEDAGADLKHLKDSIDAIAYTRGPGLAGSLLVGQITAQTLSYLYGLPLVDVNHLEGHLYAALLEHRSLVPPYLSLIVSGGHTELVIVEDYGRYSFLGGTRDDAAGEAFDKVAKLLNLEYPGGPVIDRLAQEGDPRKIPFPRPYLPGTWEFSFSGLKTAVVNYVKRENGKKMKKPIIADICASFQQAVIDTLIEKTMRAANKHCMKTIVLGGGVSANSELRRQFLKRGKKEQVTVYLPSLPFCTDNAAMIACAGHYRYMSTWYRDTETARKIEPSMKLQNWSDDYR
jgi:N6-L-threonylcarbamoyladenine synthase